MTEDGARADLPVLLYDGTCRLCQGTVRFVRRRLKEAGGAAPIRFVPAQSEEGQAILEDTGLSGEGFHSILLVEGDRTSRRSTAVLRTARWMRIPWRGLAVLRVVPRPLRDAVYDVVARNRYRWSGKTDEGPDCACGTDQRRS